MSTVAILGAGVMGETLLAAILRAGQDPSTVSISEKRAERADELRATYDVEVADAATAVRGADIVLVVVKPQDVPSLLAEVGGEIDPTAVVVSLAAGVRTATFEAALPQGAAVVRAMPNTPAVVGAGMFGVSPGASCDDDRLQQVVQLLRAGGEVVVVDESHQDAVTAVSGSGPAYVFYLAEQMIAGGIEAGLDPDVARTLAAQTLVGSARLLAESGEDAAELRRRVTSPNGTTAAAIETFDAAGVDAGLRSGVLAAAQRSAELSAG